MIAYIKCSTDRDPAFAIRTELLAEDGKTRIRKCPATPAAAAHVRSLKEKEEGLKRQFNGSRFVPNVCMPEADGSVSFEVLRGMTQERVFDGLLGDPAALIRAFSGFAGEIRQTADTEFAVTDAFTSVFGQVRLEGTRPAQSCADIDLIPSNCMLDGDRLHVIDYEWTFFFPVPVDYVIWRALHYYVQTSGKRAFLLETDLYARCGIRREDEEVFLRMERQFQRYTAGGVVRLSGLLHDLVPAPLPAADLLRARQQEMLRPAGKLYLDTGNGFTEEHVRLFPAGSDGTVSFSLETEGVRAVRLDPAEEACVITFPENAALRPDGGNGVFLGGGRYVFSGNDPQLVFSDLPKGRPFSGTYRISLGPADVRAALEEAMGVLQSNKIPKLLQKGKNFLSKTMHKI